MRWLKISTSHALFFATLLVSTLLNAQEESIPRIQDHQEITISVSKKPEPIFSEFDSYVMDIEYVDSSFYILMREIFHHHLVLLDEYMQPLDTLSFNFHPLDLLEDCQHNPVILSKDSMYIVAKSGNHLEIISRESKRSYFRFTKNCVGMIYDHFYMQSIYDHGNLTYYYEQEPLRTTKHYFYSIVDSMMLKSDREEFSRISTAMVDHQQSGENRCR